MYVKVKQKFIGALRRLIPIRGVRTAKVRHRRLRNRQDRLHHGDRDPLTLLSYHHRQEECDKADRRDLGVQIDQ